MSDPAPAAPADDATPLPAVPAGARILCLGFGYTARAFAATLPADVLVVATTRDPAKAETLRREGRDAIVFDGSAPNADLAAAIAQTTHILASASPRTSDSDGDPFLVVHEADIAAAPHLAWMGYLSTVGVYGDHDGGWVDEDAECRPTLPRGRERLLAEARWRALGEAAGVPVGIFRLAGIYGPGRNPLVSLAEGKARRIAKPGQVFNRIHVEDIARVLRHAIARPASAIYNVADQEPAPPDEVVVYAAALMGVAPPPPVAFEDADLSPMGRSFYGEVKRIDARRIREDLGVTLRYPTYREGLTALWQTGRWRD